MASSLPLRSTVTGGTGDPRRRTLLPPKGSPLASQSASFNPAGSRIRPRTASPLPPTAALRSAFARDQRVAAAQESLELRVLAATVQRQDAARTARDLRALDARERRAHHRLIEIHARECRAKELAQLEAIHAQREEMLEHRLNAAAAQRAIALHQVQARESNRRRFFALRRLEGVAELSLRQGAGGAGEFDEEGDHDRRALQWTDDEKTKDDGTAGWEGGHSNGGAFPLVPAQRVARSARRIVKREAQIDAERDGHPFSSQGTTRLRKRPSTADGGRSPYRSFSPSKLLPLRPSSAAAKTDGVDTMQDRDPPLWAGPDHREEERLPSSRNAANLTGDDPELEGMWSATPPVARPSTGTSSRQAPPRLRATPGAGSSSSLHRAGGGGRSTQQQRRSKLLPTDAVRRARRERESFINSLLAQEDAKRQRRRPMHNDPPPPPVAQLDVTAGGTSHKTTSSGSFAASSAAAAMGGPFAAQAGARQWQRLFGRFHNVLQDVDGGSSAAAFATRDAQNNNNNGYAAAELSDLSCVGGGLQFEDTGPVFVDELTRTQRDEYACAATRHDDDDDDGGFVPPTTVVEEEPAVSSSSSALPPTGGAADPDLESNPNPYARQAARQRARRASLGETTSDSSSSQSPPASNSSQESGATVGTAVSSVVVAPQHCTIDTGFTPPEDAALPPWPPGEQQQQQQQHRDDADADGAAHPCPSSPRTSQSDDTFEGESIAVLPALPPAASYQPDPSGPHSPASRPPSSRPPRPPRTLTVAQKQERAAAVLQRWTVQCVLAVIRRRRVCLFRRAQWKAEAQRDAEDIVRREHAAGDIQRLWRKTRR